MEANLAKSFVQVCSAVENVTRDTVGQVGNQKYKYATLEQVLNMLNPLLAEAKLSASCFVEGDSLRTILVHESGSMHDFGAYPLGGFSKQQERGSAISYARRYQLCAIFGITQEDDDAASASKPIFKNAALRNEYFKKLDKAVEDCSSVKQLEDLWKEHQLVLTQCKNGNEYDVLCYDDMVAKFKRAKENRQEAEDIAKEGMKQLDDSIPY